MGLAILARVKGASRIPAEGSVGLAQPSLRSAEPDRADSKFPRKTSRQHCSATYFGDSLALTTLISEGRGDDLTSHNAVSGANLPEPLSSGACSVWDYREVSQII